MHTRPERPKIAAIGGDGIGPEVTAAALRVLEAACGEGVLDVDELPYGADHTLNTGETLPEGELDRWARTYHAILLGALGDPRIPDMRHGRDILLGARRELDLFINERPARLLDPTFCPLRDDRGGERDAAASARVDLVLFRENTEGAYAGMGGTLKRGRPGEVAVTEMVATREGTERILRAAFEHARDRRRGRLCMATKSNAIPHAHGLWARLFDELAPEYPEVEAEALYADVAAMELVRAPERFDVLVAPNLLGDVLSDLSAQLVGGMGLAASANVHPGRTSLFEPVHGSAPDLAGTGRANPVATILSGAMLLRHVGRDAEAERVERAAEAAVAHEETTPDLGGSLGTEEATDAIIRRL